MISFATFLTCLAALTSVLVAGLCRKRRAPVGGDDLDGARIFLNESTIRISTPVKLSGRPDQIWRRKDGKLIPVETKQRRFSRQYPSDAVQLSAQRFLTVHSRRARDNEFMDYGYIRIVRQNHAALFIRVSLLGDGEIIQRQQRVQALITGKVKPLATPSKSLCSGCGHRHRCHFAFGS